MLPAEEQAAGAVVQALGREGLQGRCGAEALAALRDDAGALGLVGLLAALCEPPAADPAIAAELPAALRRDLLDALPPGSERADAGEPLGELCARFVAGKGAHGADLLRRLVARVVHELYDLGAHRLTQEDALAALLLLAAAGPGQDARETARRLVRLSRHAARTVLGHLDNQLELVHELGQREGELPLVEIDRRLSDYAPRLFAARLPAMLRRLVSDEPRLRLAFVVWGRLRGVTLGRAAIQGLAAHVVPERPEALVEALLARGPARAALRAADAAAPEARALEAALRSGL